MTMRNRGWLARNKTWRNKSWRNKSWRDENR